MEYATLPASEPQCVLICARTSVDFGGERSLEDQIPACRLSRSSPYCVEIKAQTRPLSLEQVGAIVKAHQFDLLIVESLDRLFRASDLRQLAATLNLRIISVNDGIDSAEQINGEMSEDS